MRYIASQCREPRGVMGNVFCKIMNVSNKKMYQSIVDLIEKENQMKILEIGYGNGYMTNMIFQKTGAEIFGIDISKDMKESALKRNQEGVKQGKIHLDLGDCCNLQYTPDFFEYVVTMNTIYFWSDTVKGLSQIYRVLKEGGIFYNVVYSKKSLEKLPYTKEGFQIYEKEDFMKFGTQAGFSEVEFKEIGEILIVKYIKKGKTNVLP